MGVSYCIMNRQGVAFASDTAVTISGRTAIFENGIKIFSLGEGYNIGSMHFGDTTVLGISDEVFMTMYRDYLSKEKPEIKSIIDAPKQLISFLKENKEQLRLQQDEEVSVDRKLVRMIKQDLFQAIDVASNQNLTRENTIDTFIDIFSERIEEQISLPTESYYEYVRTTYEDRMKTVLNNAVNVTFSETQLDTLLDSLTKGIIGVISEHLVMLFAGYGQDDLYPSSVELHILGYYNGSIQYLLGEPDVINERVPNQVHTACYGECDVIYSFKHDVDQTVQDRYFDILKQDILEYIQNMDDRIMDYDEKSDLFSRIMKAMENTYGFMRHSIAENVQSVEDILSKISVDDLIAYAENMVNIAKVKSLYTLNRETQGTVTGDIVSAKITCYNGFKWVKPHHGTEV